MKRILLPVKGSRNDTKAGEIAGIIGQELNGEVTIFHVEGSDLLTPEQATAITRIKNRLDDLNGLECRMVSATVSPDAAGAILSEAAKGGYSYIIMGARQDAVNGTKIVGSTSRFVLEKAPCPVMIVKDVEEANLRK